MLCFHLTGVLKNNLTGILMRSVRFVAFVTFSLHHGLNIIFSEITKSSDLHIRSHVHSIPIRTSNHLHLFSQHVHNLENMKRSVRLRVR